MENKQARHGKAPRRAWNGPESLAGRGLQRLDARVKIVVFALHAFVHHAQYAVGVVAECLLVVKHTVGPVPTPREGLVG